MTISTGVPRDLDTFNDDTDGSHGDDGGNEDHYPPLPGWVATMIIPIIFATTCVFRTSNS